MPPLEIFWVKIGKNIEFAIELFAILLKNYSVNIHLDIYGQSMYQIYLEEIVLLIRSKNMDNNISIIQNCFNIEDKLKKYQLALHTSKLESGPLVLLEYMSQGMLFLTYKTGEAAEQIADHFPDLIMTDFNIDNWANQIKKLMNSDLTKIQKKMISYFKTNYSEEEYYSKCMSIYHNVLTS